MRIKDNRKQYYDRWHEDEGGKKYRYRARRSLRHFERDQKKLASEGV